jgi:YMGG-like Gly-zipper
MVMRTFTWLVCAPALVAVAACGRGKTADDVLKNDLALASQAQAYNPNFNPNESGYAQQNAPQYASSNAPRAIQTAARQPVYRRPSTARRSSSSSNSGYYPAPSAPPVVVEKHTQRDAAIGAAAGAVLGATTSRDKVKGGLIGAMVGGVLGGVIGNNVDITHKSGW